MCLFNTPSTPKVETPAAPQQAKAPDTPQMMAAQRKARGVGQRPATLLTGDAGAAPTANQLGKATLLGA